MRNIFRKVLLGLLSLLLILGWLLWPPPAQEVESVSQDNLRVALETPPLPLSAQETDVVLIM